MTEKRREERRGEERRGEGRRVGVKGVAHKLASGVYGVTAQPSPAQPNSVTKQPYQYPTRVIARRDRAIHSAEQAKQVYGV